MTKKIFAFIVLSLILNGFRSATAISLMIPTTSGQIIRNITPFERSSSTAEDVYNYINARYNGTISIDFGTNLFWINTLDGLSLFVVNQVDNNLVGQLQYQITTEGMLLFRDDQPGVDNDPVTIIPNADSTTTFISQEGFGGPCINGFCPTDGLVIGLSNEDAIIDWKYDLSNSSLPLINIEQINFWSSQTSENFSLELFTEFDPENGQIALNVIVPESSSLGGLLIGSVASFMVKRIKTFRN